MQPSSYHPLLLFHVGDDTAAVCCPRAMKKDVRVCKGIQISAVGSDIGRLQKGDYVSASLSIRKSSWNAVYQVSLQPMAQLALHCVLHRCMAVSLLATGTWFQKLHWSPSECQSCNCVCFSHIRTRSLRSPVGKFYLHPLEQSRIYILMLNIFYFTKWSVFRRTSFLNQLSE